MSVDYNYGTDGVFNLVTPLYFTNNVWYGSEYINSNVVWFDDFGIGFTAHQLNIYIFNLKQTLAMDAIDID